MAMPSAGLKQRTREFTCPQGPPFLVVEADRQTGLTTWCGRCLHGTQVWQIQAGVHEVEMPLTLFFQTLLFPVHLSRDYPISASACHPCPPQHATVYSRLLQQDIIHPLSGWEAEDGRMETVCPCFPSRASGSRHGAGYCVNLILSLALQPLARNAF